MNVGKIVRSRRGDNRRQQVSTQRSIVVVNTGEINNPNRDNRNGEVSHPPDRSSINNRSSINRDRTRTTEEETELSTTSRQQVVFVLNVVRELYILIIDVPRTKFVVLIVTLRGTMPPVVGMHRPLDNIDGIVAFEGILRAQRLM